MTKNDNLLSNMSSSLAPGPPRPHMMRTGATPGAIVTWKQGSNPMHLRKTLIVGAAVLAAGLLGLSATATASTPGSTVSSIEVDGSTVNGTVAKTGVWKGGTATINGSNYGCTGGSVGGTVVRGAYTAGTTAMTFPTLNIVCATPLGTNANVNMKAGCSATVSFNDLVHTGLTDTGVPGGKFHRVAGTLTILPACSARVSVFGGICTADVSGQAPAYFDEFIKPSNDQTLGLNGAGLSLSGGTGLCGTLLSGAFNLNDVRFWIPKTIDFR